MDIETKIDLVKRPPTTEVLTDEELRNLFQTNTHPKHYIGFEISGLVHLGTGVATTLKVKDLMKAGVKPTIWLADYHAWINGKLGGNLELIREIARGYFKHCFISLGLEEGAVEFKLASEHYGPDFWKDVIQISKNTTLKRMLRCMTIMGRKEGDAVESAHLLYPAMQAADMFLLDIDIAQAGTDQRKVQILAREVAEKLGKKKPIALHGHLIMGLQGPQKMGLGSNEKEDLEISSKMSKSKPETCIYIHDSPEEIKRKINRAYCPEKQAENNPIIELAEYFFLREKPLNITRPAKYGGDVSFQTPAELKTEYAAGKLHPSDLKNSVCEELVKMLEPSRKYFEKNHNYLEQVKDLHVTR